MFKKILIANRGEIACRVAATARRMAIRTVAVYSDADAHANHVQRLRRIGATSAAARPKTATCAGKSIIEAAKATGAQAIHPGYGFLSENEEPSRQACAEAGLVFIGPPAFGHQGHGPESRVQAADGKGRRAAGARLPRQPTRTRSCCKREADRIGYPVLIKASAGGGGKGMRAVEQGCRFSAPALASCQREAHQQLR
jgi:3-methylcrotonyl-CoA carboxylase alpha subunit